MNIDVLEKIEQILTYKIDDIEFNIISANKNLQSTSENIKELYNTREKLANDIKIDYEIRWLSNYKNLINTSLYNHIHLYASQRCEINRLKILMLKENQRKNAISKMAEKIKSNIQIIKNNKEDEDVEELCITKQYI